MAQALTAVYIAGDSALVTRTQPEASWWGVSLALAAAIICHPERSEGSLAGQSADPSLRSG
jgi:hypothetical protein